MAESIPQKLGKYEIRGVLGKGAMGIVYDGFDPLIERRVAIKAVHKNILEGEDGTELLNRFKKEAQAAGRLMHQNIVGVFEYGEENGVPFIAMEFIQGKELKEHIREQARFEVKQIVDIMTQILDAMEYVHAAGVVHRDMKPANIILLPNGTVKVADFGIARIENSTLTQLGAVMGTPSYMSPEQFMGQRVDNRSDLFSLGVILYELLTGEKPFPGKAVATIMQKVLHAPVEDPTSYNFELTGSFNAVIQKALSKRPTERFQSAKEFSEALRQAERGEYAANQPAVSNEAVEEDEEATILVGAAPLPKGGTGRAMASAPQPQASPAAAAPPRPDIAPVPSRKPSLALLLGGGVVLVAVAVAGWWFLRGTPTLPLPENAVETHRPLASIPSQSSSPSRSSSQPQSPSQTQPSPVLSPESAPGSLLGSLTASTHPSGAKVLVDGTLRGVTPLTFDLASGEYQLILSLEGFDEVVSIVDVEKGESLEIDRILDAL